MSIALSPAGAVAWDEFIPPYGYPEQLASPDAVPNDSELQRLIGKMARELADWRSPASRQQETAAAAFARLASRWREETAFVSSVHDMAMHPSYQEIIGLGESAVPYILKDLARDQDHWFWALRSITHVDPVPECDRGNVPRMAEAWLGWGRDHGYEF